MITWLKSIFGITKKPEVAPLLVEEDIIPDTAPVVEKSKSVAKPKKKTKKSSGKTCDFDKLTKTQLLAEAKHRGVKANASLSKAEILTRLKNV